MPDTPKPSLDEKWWSDFLPGDGSVAAVRAEYEANCARGPDQASPNPYTQARVGLLLREHERVVAERAKNMPRAMRRRRG